MSIFPLPQFETDLEAQRADREAYEKLKAPKTLVVRFGAMRLVGEYPYAGDAKPGCGSKIVVRTHRGTELGEMLTSTCPNAGCSKSVSRKEMLDFIENSGGRDYPFFTEGRALRVATIEDLNEQARLDALAPQMLRKAREVADFLRLPMKVVEAEPILGRERLTFYFTAEERIDFRELVTELSREFAARIEMRQVGARDEARLTADYERCGQHCCCKQFLKVLKPVNIKSAKTQKATLDPLKISGRCGRLMCCLRYEDQTYEELVARLPRLKKRVGTPEGPGIVVDRQILTQLVLVRLEATDQDRAFAVEDLVPPDEAPRPAAAPDPLRGVSPEDAERRLRRGPAENGGPSSASSAQPSSGAPGADRAARQEAFKNRARRGAGGPSAPGAPGAPAREPSSGPAAPRPDRGERSRPPETPRRGTHPQDRARPGGPGGQGARPGAGAPPRGRGGGPPSGDRASPSPPSPDQAQPGGGPPPDTAPPGGGLEGSGPEGGASDTGGGRRGRRRRRRRRSGPDGPSGGESMDGPPSAPGPGPSDGA